MNLNRSDWLFNTTCIVQLYMTKYNDQNVLHIAAEHGCSRHLGLFLDIVRELRCEDLVDCKCKVITIKKPQYSIFPVDEFKYRFNSFKFIDCIEWYDPVALRCPWSSSVLHSAARICWCRRQRNKPGRIISYIHNTNIRISIRLVAFFSLGHWNQLNIYLILYYFISFLCLCRCGTPRCIWLASISMHTLFLDSMLTHTVLSNFL